MQISKTQQNLQKTLLVFQIIAFQMVAHISFDYNENACQQQSMC